MNFKHRERQIAQNVNSLYLKNTLKSAEEQL